MRVAYDDMLKEFNRVLLKKGFDEKTALEAATNFAQTSLDGVYSHGINRFPRIPGGYDSEDNITTDPSEIEKTWRVLPVGFWKGSGLSIVFDMIATILSGGNSVGDIGGNMREEAGLSQVLMAIDPTKFSTTSEMDAIVDKIIADVKESEPISENGTIFYPGESSLKTRKENMEHGIPVVEDIWNKILNM